MLAVRAINGPRLATGRGLQTPSRSSFTHVIKTPLPSLRARGRTMQCCAGDAKLHFTVNRQIAFGETHKIVGSHPALGGWDVRSAPDMQWEDGNVWTLDLNLPAGTEFEFKCVKLAGDDVDWEYGNNHHLQVPDASVVDVEFEWSNDGSVHIAPHGSADGGNNNGKIDDASSRIAFNESSEESAPTPVSGASKESVFANSYS